jgi:hypothetical protein
VVERGTHDTLLAMSGLYAQMWSLQQRAQAATEQAVEALEAAGETPLAEVAVGQ